MTRLFLELFDEAGILCASTFLESDSMVSVPARHMRLELEREIAGVRVTLVPAGSLAEGERVDMVPSNATVRMEETNDRYDCHPL